MSPLLKQPLGIEYALLGLLRQYPMHGYGLYRRLYQPKGLGDVWPLKQSYLYSLLLRLEAEGCIVGHVEFHSDCKTRKVCHLTPQGQTTFKVWLNRPIQPDHDLCQEFLAKLFFVSQDQPDKVQSLIECQRYACQAWLADMQDDSGIVAPESLLVVLAMAYQIRQVQALLDWLDQCALGLDMVWRPPPHHSQSY